jgi:hypothetical protein
MRRFARRRSLVILSLALVATSCGARSSGDGTTLASDELRDPADHPNDDCAASPEPRTLPDPPLAIEFRTDQEQYTLVRDSVGFRVKIAFTYVNRTGRTIYVANCRQIEQIALQKKGCGQWIPAWAGAYPMCLSPPLVIPHGSSHSGTVDVFAGTPGGNYYPQFEVSDPGGTFRLVWHGLYWSFDPNRSPFGEALSRELNVSAEFALQTPP